jgi:hypothetical protein
MGKWERNKENGWGAYFCPHNTPSQHNPHSEQMIFIGDFRNGCPTEGMVIECTDFRELKAENFTLQHEATTNEISAQAFRVYEVTYDGVSAFWQLPVPKRKKGLFDLKFKLCEYEVRRVDRPLTHKRSLEEIWYKWIPNPKSEKKESMKNLPEGSEDDNKVAGAETPVAPTATTFEAFYFHGTCIRDKTGQFPCPTDGTLSIFPGTKGSPKSTKCQPLVEYKAKFNSISSNSPTLHSIAGKAKYAIPADNCE